MLIFVKSQQPLFDATIQVAAHVRHDGTMVRPHTRVQKVAAKKPAAVPQRPLFDEPKHQAPAAKPGKLDQFIAGQGGHDALSAKLQQLTAAQQQILFDRMAELGKQPVDDIRKRFAEAKPRELKRGESGDLFSRPHEDPAKPESNGAEFGTLYHGTAQVVDELKIQQPGTGPSRGGGEHHQGRGIYLTDDRQGYARYFANAAASKVSFFDRHAGKITQAEADAMEESGGAVLSVELKPEARILDLRGGDRFGLLEMIRQKQGDKVAETVLQHGYDGIAFHEPTDIEGWNLKENATTIAVYRDGLVKVNGHERGTDADPRAARQAQPAEPAHTPFGVQPGTSKAERRALNAQAAEIALTKPAGELTDADRAVLRQYSGNGGCGDSLNEFYTDPQVAAAMWEVINRIGPASGTALEPSCGAGVFLHTAPAGFKVTGVEMETVSAAVAEKLHGDRHEVRQASLERFASSDGGRQFDVVIGNPPYGPRGSLVKDDKPELKTAERYFIDTAIDKAKPGGIVALVVPAGVMDAKNGRRFRERMLRKAEFLGAQRMPNTAFEASHTDVTADVVWLRKRPDDVAGALMTVDKAALTKLGVWDDEFLAGTYFSGRGADNVFGQVGTAMRSFGEVYTVNGSMAGVPEAIAGFAPDSRTASPTVHQIVEALGDDDAAVRRAMGAAAFRPYADAKVGDTKVVDGVTYVLQGRPPRWHRVDELMAHEAVTDAEPLAREIENLMTGRVADRPALEAGIRAYIARHGLPVKSKQLVQAAEHNTVLHRLIGAVDHDGRLSDVVTGQRQAVAGGSIDTAAQTLAAERTDGDFTVAELAERSGRSEDDVTEALMASDGYAYLVPGTWTTMDRYLTGNLWLRYDAARSPQHPPEMAAKLEMQVKRLEEAIDPKSLEDVDFALNTGFIPPHVIKAWMDAQVQELRDAHPEASYYQGLPEAHVSFERSLYSISGGMWGQADLLEKYLNRTGVRQDDMPKIERWNEEFRSWVRQSNYRDEVEDLYNRKFRGYAAPKWSRDPIEIPGLDTAGGTRLPNDYHWDSLRWALHAGKGIIADDVGLGKTLRGLMLARLAKMYGKAAKPSFVLPKSVLANWVAEAEMWFPGSRVLVIGETYTRDKDGTLKSKTDNETERNRKYHELSQNDYDFVFISRDSFNELDVDPITKGEYLEQDFWVQRGDRLGNSGDKQVKRVRENYKQAVADREFGKRTDAIYFNDLGIDMLVVDEAHAYKNLYAARARFGESPKFLGGQGQSNRAFDMSFKAKWLREQNEGRGLYALTATPTKNSPLEIYSMLSYVAPEEFDRIGVRNSEEFLDRYCVFKRENVLGTDGEISEQLVTAGFKNLNELRSIMDRFIMRRKASDVGLKIPKAQQEMHLVDMTREQSAVYGELRAMLAESGKKDATGDAHVFSIMDKMAKAAMDLELLDQAAYAGQASPKYEEVAKHVKANVGDGGQIIFCESVDSHEKIAAALERAGIPRSRVAILNAKTASSSAARQNISDKFNKGTIDVVIGNKVMEEGVNLQKRTADIHDLDTPWDPATLQQRHGRGVRQGNRNESVRVHAYLARGSFDGYRYQSMSAKRDWMDLLWHGGDSVENLAREGKFSREDMMVMMSADPEAERAKLAKDRDAAVQRLTAERTEKAVGEFVRFQELRRNFNGLKNKDTAAGRRLQMQLEKARGGLRDNKYFHAKSALDSNEDVLLHPQSGQAITKDQGYEASEPDGTTSRWVVTGVDAVKSTISMRRYADTGGGKGVTVPLAKFSDGVKPFVFDKDAEASEVREKLAADAQSKLESVKRLDDVMAMPAAVVEANHDMLQQRLKDGAKNYAVDVGSSKVYMVNRETGALEAVESYNVRGKTDTHDFALPTEKLRQQAIDAWKDAERKAHPGRMYVSIGRGRSQKSLTRIKPDYSDAGASYSDKQKNPMTDLLAKIGGKATIHGDLPPLARQARAELHTEQAERVRRAKTSADAFREALPLGTYSDADPDTGKHPFTLPENAMAMLWARAAANGELEKDVKAVYGKHAPAVFRSSYQGLTVQAGLVALARAGGHHRLALAMSKSADKRLPNRDAKAAIQEVLPSWAYDKHAPELYRMARRHAERGGLLNQTMPRPAGTGYFYGNETYQTYLDKQIAEADEHAARAAAKETTP